MRILLSIDFPFTIEVTPEDVFVDPPEEITVDAIKEAVMENLDEFFFYSEAELGVQILEDKES